MAHFLARPEGQSRTQYLDALTAKAARENGVPYRSAVEGELGPVRRWISRDAIKKALQRAELRYRNEPDFKAETDKTADLMRVLIDVGQQFHEPTPPKRKKKATAPHRGK